jgi:hypothetical protein
MITSGVPATHQAAGAVIISGVPAAVRRAAGAGMTSGVPAAARRAAGPCSPMAGHR